MATPKGTYHKKVPTANPREAVHIYSDQKRIVLQLRRLVPTEEELKGTSYKVAVVLSVDQAALVAGELLSLANKHFAINKANAANPREAVPQQNGKKSSAKPGAASNQNQKKNGPKVKETVKKNTQPETRTAEPYQA